MKIVLVIQAFVYLVISLRHMCRKHFQTFKFIHALHVACALARPAISSQFVLYGHLRQPLHTNFHCKPNKKHSRLIEIDTQKSG